jgi:HK97 gp10 family phage protein
MNPMSHGQYMGHMNRISQNELSACMRKIDERLNDIRSKAADALNSFADEMAGHARQLAPVRKAYSTGKAKRKMRSSYHQMSDAEIEAFSAMAAKTSFVDRFGKRQPGYFSPHYQTGQSRIKNRRRIPKRGIVSRNRPDSPYRKIGVVNFRDVRVPLEGGTGIVSTFHGEIHPTKGWQRKAYITPAKRTIPREMIGFRHGKGVVIGHVALRRESETSTWRIARTTGDEVSITGVGRGVLKHLNAKQRYDLLHGRGVYLKFNAWGTKATIVMGGRLRSSIEAQAGSSRFQRLIVAEAPYAKYVEFGTRYMEAQPFLYPTLMVARRRMAGAIAKGVRG